MASKYEVEVTLTSAKDLKNVNWRYGPIRPYAVVWVDPQRKSTTRADDDNDISPQWGDKIIIPLDRPIEDSTLYIDVVHAKTPEEDTKPLIGSAKLSLREIVDEAGLGNNIPRTLKLRRPSGRPHGKIEVDLVIRDHRYRASDPYAAPYGVRGYDAPPVPAYGAPAPSGYPYGGSTAGYPYVGAPVGYGQGSYGGGVVEKKSKFGGMGMGTGLAVGAVGGLLGGLVLAEGIDKLEDHVADEAAERVEEYEDEDEDEDDGHFDGGDDDGGW